MYIFSFSKLDTSKVSYFSKIDIIEFLHYFQHLEKKA